MINDRETRLPSIENLDPHSVRGFQFGATRADPGYKSYIVGELVCKDGT